jgi:hypothetical protein
MFECSSAKLSSEINVSSLTLAPFSPRMWWGRVDAVVLVLLTCVSGIMVVQIISLTTGENS